MSEREKIYDSLNEDNWKITHSEEYHDYIKALCRLASGYVSRIRVKFAEMAFEKYKDPTIRKLVLAYGEECAKLDVVRFNDFRYVSEYGASSEERLNDSCLINAHEYGKAIWFLFGIDDKKEDEEK